MSTILISDYTEIGAMCWGDLAPSCESPSNDDVCRLCDGPCYRGVNHTFEDDALSGWSLPDLNLRKNIWENFPVNVVPIESSDETARYALTWNLAKFNAWRQERAESFDEGMEYEAFCETRLLYALKLHGSRYIVEEPRNERQICVIAMVHDGSSHASSSESVCASEVSSSTQSTTTGVLRLRTILDIRKHFPVNWKQEGNVIRLEFHRANLRAQGIPESEVRDRLLEALNASYAWTVRASRVASVICELVLPEVPVLNNIKDVRDNFPVIWKQEGNVFRLEFHRANLRSSGQSETLVRENLLKAVRASSAWTVQTASPPFLCELVLV